MSDNVYYILGAIVMLIAVVAIVAGIKSVVAESKKVWSMLRDRFAVSSEDYSDTSGPKCAPGKLAILNQEFVGSASVIESGIIFRQDLMSGYELVLFPWSVVKEFKTEKAERYTASFSIETDDGSAQTVQIPWSEDLASRAPTDGLSDSP